MYIPLHPAWTPNQHPPLNRALHVSHGISGPRHAVASVGCGHCRKISCRQSNRLRFQERWPSVLKTQAPKAPTNASFYQVAWKLRMRAQKTHFRSLGKKWCQKPTNKQSEHIYIYMYMYVCVCVFSLGIWHPVISVPCQRVARLHQITHGTSWDGRHESHLRPADGKVEAGREIKSDQVVITILHC